MQDDLEKKYTFCRICEAYCGLEVTTAGDQVVSVKPDKKHPVSKGYACIKGTSYADLHHGDNRVNQPLKRVGDAFEPISWSQALSEIGTRIRVLKKEHGARSIAHYLGNPTFFNTASALLLSDFAAALGSPNVFCSHSVDLNNKFYASKLFYGLDELSPIPDLNHCDFFMCLGGNPVVSQMSVINVVDPLKKLRDIESRGGQVYIVDPRKTETANKVGHYLPIPPGADIFMLLGFMYILLNEFNIEKDNIGNIESYSKHFSDLSSAVKEWTPERVAPLTGIKPEELRKIVGQYVQASQKNGAVLYMSTGVNMSGFGSVCYWLIQAINFVSGNFDRRGGSILPVGSFNLLALLLKLDKIKEKDSSHKTLVSGWGKIAGYFPVGALPEEILCSHSNRIRALFISAGNPCHSMPSPDWDTAMKKLDLVVSVDIFVSDTAKTYADYILPSVDMLERSDAGIAHSNLQLEPHAFFTRAVTPAKFERKPDWEIFSDLLKVSGIKSYTKPLAMIAVVNQLLKKVPFLKARVIPEHLFRILTRKQHDFNYSKLEKSKRGLPLPEHSYGEFFKHWPKEKIFDLAPSELINDLVRVQNLEKTMLKWHEETSDKFWLIGRRDRRLHNSWMRHNKGIRQLESNKATIHTQDALRLGINEKDTILIATDRGEIQLPVQITEDIAKQVIAVPHGWGELKVDLPLANKAENNNDALDTSSGANVNSILQAKMEPGSGQAVLTGQRVTVRAI